MVNVWVDHLRETISYLDSSGCESVCRHLQNKIDASRKNHRKNGVNPKKYPDGFHQPRTRIARTVLSDIDQDGAKGDDTSWNEQGFGRMQE